MNPFRRLLSNRQAVSSQGYPLQQPASQNSLSVCTDLQELMNLRSAVAGMNSSKSTRSEFHRLGNQRSNTRGHGIEFSDVRVYGAGDDTRHIDWRLTARCTQAMTRLFSEERDQPAYIMVDQRCPMYFGSHSLFKSVQAARLGALLAWHCHAMRIQFGGLLSGAALQKIKINHSRQAIVTLLNAIVHANQRLSNEHRASKTITIKAEPSLSEALQLCAANTPVGACVSVISDFHDFDRTAQARLAMLAKLRTVNLYKITDPVETDLEISGLVGVSNGAQNRTLPMTAARSQQYREARAVKDSILQQCAENLRCTLTEVSTADQMLMPEVAMTGA